jgi:sialate O-acetylesterase
VRLGPYSAAAKSDAAGKFFMRLPPMKAGGPFELTAQSGKGEKAVSKDIVVGEVWLASGQSNMQWTVEMSGKNSDPVTMAEDPLLRMAEIPRATPALSPQPETQTEWKKAGAENTAVFSAVAHYFAQKLRRELDVPVGIINSSWGGTIIEAWTSRQTLMENPDLKPMVERYEADLFSPDFHAAAQKSYPADPGNEGGNKGWAKPDFDDKHWKIVSLPSGWQSCGFKYSGVLWFRKTVDIPRDWTGRDLSLKVGAVDKQDITYFNGKQVGATGSGLEDVHWNKVREYTVPGRLVKAGRNVIAVRAYSFVYEGGLIGPASKMLLAPADGGDTISLAGEWSCETEHNFGAVTPITPPAGPGNPNSPYILFDNMIAPLAPYALRGAIWYQGESNAMRAKEYSRLMRDMIRDWRHVWGQGNFPFLTTQLANFRAPESFNEKSEWALLREAQFQSLAEPNTGMAVIIDTGEELNIHPANKWDVGGRLARWALSDTYSKSVVPSGPLYDGMTTEGGAIRVRFKFTGGGLKAKGGPLKTFYIAGQDKQFQPAEAEIDGATVVVSSPKVKYPVAARYAWADNPAECNLYNSEGLPASPFRTDSW